MIKLRSKISTLEEVKKKDIEAYKMYKDIASSEDYEFLYKGDVYLGFGIILCNKGIYVLVATEDDDYMTLKPLAFFDIIDYTIPSNWIFSSGENFNSNQMKVYSMYSFKEIADDLLFYERLIDGDAKYENIFNRIKKDLINILH